MWLAPVVPMTLVVPLVPVASVVPMVLMVSGVPVTEAQPEPGWERLLVAGGV